MLLEDTIAAISTAVGEGAIAVLRVSGPEAANLVAPIFRGSTALEKMEPRRSYFGEIYDVTGVVDQVLVTIFRGPQSYTGEDLIEVQVPRGAANNDFAESPDEWVRRWPAEEVWFARRGSASTGR